MRWRLGIDLGTSSLGWCAIELRDNNEPFGILGAGSRIFSDGRDRKSGASLAVDRRAARAMRRRGDRFKRRQAALLKHLALDGLFPADPAERKALEALDPYELRARALDEPLEPFHIGRAFFHLNQRRGFQSNRKTDRADGDETGKIAVGIDRLEAAIGEIGARTFGDFLHLRRKSELERTGPERHNHIPSVRTRLRPETGEGAKGDGYDFYPGRDLVKAEFDAIFEAQAAYHPTLLTDAVHDRLFEIVFHQRPLKEPRIGKCTLIPTDERLPKAHPLFQRRRLLEEINALMIVRPGEVAERLTPEQRNILLLKLRDTRKARFESLRKLLKLDPDARFSKESDNRPEMLGDEITAQLADKKRFGPRWLGFTVDAQWAVVEMLRNAEDTGELLRWLTDQYGLDTEHAKAVAGIHLPEGFGRFGKMASERLIAALERETTDDGKVIVYNEAVERAGLGHHSDFRTGEALDELPYYGTILERHLLPGTGEPGDPEELRIGRLTNPTVHIGLNQLRRTINRLIAAYGPPTEIAIELARELKMSEEDKAKVAADNNRNRRDAEQRSDKLREIGKSDTGANRALLKLWEELNPGNVLDRRCIYTGEQISIDMLFNGSVEVDHILPFTATLDDSNGNKIVCLREANRLKRKRSPFEAFGHTAEWEEIAARASRLPKSKRWRFEPDAMQRFDQEGGFLARQLTDTQHLARLAREYLSALYPGRGEGSSHVWVSPGRLTEMVRRKLGLNELLPDHNYGAPEQPKNRLDHRHHAIDAAVIAIVDRSMLQAIARASALEGQEGRERIHIPEPWEGFREELRRVVTGITVSHRVDHGTASKKGLPKGHDQTAGRLHNDTAYGLTGETDAKGNTIVVRRLPVAGLKPDHLGDDVSRGVRDTVLRNALRAFTRGKDGKAFEQALRDFPQKGALPFRGLRRVRVVEPLAVIPIRDQAGRAYKGYKGDSNYRYDVWELPDGKWQAEVVSMFDAHQPGWVSKVRAGCPTAKKVLSLQQNDLLAIEPEGAERRLMRVVKFRQNGQITLGEPQEAGDLKRRDAQPNDQDPFKYTTAMGGVLKGLRARQVRIDEIGRIADPGFPARKKIRKTRPKPGAA